MSKLRWLLIKLLLKKEESIMAMVYVSLIVKGKKKFSEVPATQKEKVRQILIDIDCEDLIDEE